MNNPYNGCQDWYVKEDGTIGCDECEGVAPLPKKDIAQSAGQDLEARVKNLERQVAQLFKSKADKELILR